MTWLEFRQGAAVVLGLVPMVWAYYFTVQLAVYFAQADMECSAAAFFYNEIPASQFDVVCPLVGYDHQYKGRNFA